MNHLCGSVVPCARSIHPDQFSTPVQDGGNLDVILDCGRSAVNFRGNDGIRGSRCGATLHCCRLKIMAKDAFPGPGARLCSVQKGCGLTWACVPYG
jgi:hypothetical protein